ncbi:MAG: fibronectin type III domain-containing protein [Flavobacteriales bacterium]|nr:fibronectin type III domain-containing protein [Flavobacteriales bacterium]
MKRVFAFILAVYMYNYLYSQSIIVQPYLQDAEPNRISIMWETSSNSDSWVDWGTTTSLGNSTQGIAVNSQSGAQIHTVTITGLLPATRYFYRVRTGTIVSDTFDFVSPSLPAAENYVNIVAMSDMQKDNGNPTKFQEIIHEGVLKYIADSLGQQVSDHVQMVIIPGDLVDNGLIYAQWKDDFFAPAHPLFAHVPVYPVLGNHELNTPLYFQYFTLPDNGSNGYKEHWWFKDNSNVRIIGLNSNTGYRIQIQLDWLDSVLNDACNNSAIDFVFVQLHHPHKSELWLAGEISYTGQIIQLLENFSTNCGKPSIHFFGHTHGYSRGQSRDHSHLWVNVATAGGNIDYWGEFAQQDYEEFTKSQDEYGFVFVHVEAGSNPKFTLKRFSLGDETTAKQNSLEDLITVKRYNNTPLKPIGLYPYNNALVSPDCLILKGSAFFDADNDGFGSAQWQVSTSCGDFSNPIINSWKQHENWYYDLDLQAGDDLTDEKTTTLQPNTNYCWRVRYRDKSLAWSDWSDPIPFSTGNSVFTTNLLINGGAENGTSQWTASTGVIESVGPGECGGTLPYTGNKYFAVGGICTDNAFGSAYQDVDVSAYASQIDQGVCMVKFGGYLRDWNGTDEPSYAVHFLNISNQIIGFSDTTRFTGGIWTLKETQWAVPAGTRKIRMNLMGKRNAGSDNDSYFDELFLKLNLYGDSCSQYTGISSLNEPLSIKENAQLMVFPNPMTSSAMINVPNTEGEHLVAYLINSSGLVVKDYYHIHGPTFQIQRNKLAAGIYYLAVYKDSTLIGYSKIVIK